MLKHWRIFTLLGVIIFSQGIGIWWLYDENGDLNQQIGQDKIALEIKEAEAQELTERINKLKLDVTKVQSQNQQLEANIENSKNVIKDINNDRELLLRKLAKEKLPNTCEELFYWMTEKANEITPNN